MDKIYLGKKLVAIHARSFPTETTPVSPRTEALQLVMMVRPKGDVARLHRHIPQKRVTKLLQECLIVVRGRVRYDLFDKHRRCFRKIVVREGEAALILDVPHEVRFLEDSLVYELKNGPFLDDKQYL